MPRRARNVEVAEGALQRRAEELLGKTMVALMLREPFFAHLTSGLPRCFTAEVETMAVALRGETVQLLVSPKFLVEELGTVELCAGVLKHEILHIVLGHLFRRIRDEDPFIWNLAADLSVNQLVPPFPLPDGAVTLDTFGDLELQPDLTVEEYYARLVEATEARRRFPASARAIKRLRDGGAPSDHSFWASAAGQEVGGERTGKDVPGVLVDALSRAFQDRVLQAHQRTSLSRGTVPGWLSRVVGEILASRLPKVDWRRAVRVFSASSMRTRIVTTRRRESRRFESIPGLRRSEGLKVKRYQRMAVVIDTSGSVGADQLGAFFNEIRAIHRAGCEVSIVECDADVSKVWQFDGRIPDRTNGGGGTSFDPGLQWLRDQRRFRFDACIYFTDGLAPAPTVRAPCPVLWVVCGGNRDTGHLPGRTVTID